MQGFVATTLGEVPREHLNHSIVEQPEEPGVVVVACEWHYKGGNPHHSNAIGTLVRRDVWVNVLIGQKAEGAQG